MKFLCVVALLVVLRGADAFRKSVGLFERIERRQTFICANTEGTNNDAVAGVIGGAGVVANVVVDYSLYVLKSTGCGLPSGPFGLVGAVEGVSYLTVIALIAWSVSCKVKTGSGLPAGPAGLLGASEGLSFLTILGGIVIAALNLGDFGYLPFLANDKCAL